MKNKLLIALVFLMVITTMTQAQHKLIFQTTSELKIDGTSTVSDWTVNASDIKGDLVLLKGFKPKEAGSLYATLTLSFPVEKMESGRGPIMNNKIKSALKSDEHPNVIYNSSENKIIAINDSSFILTSIGIVEVAGVKKPMEVNLNCTYDKKRQTLVMEGEQNLTMSMFQIEKPTAFFGKLQTMDALKVSFKIHANKK
ncbi:hypothetical protein APS56_09545 [Pseudalgibacter alginicilyticus]|uniref:Lipid/polyisoprenoid-binding YceI-like domain-containing protein n=1 Tax=Pseudalgibacter alginicilyticus TaxID=1736674 RepID=A0A0P0DBN6_9FLAO|nr:hypothetical protein [Pseudalgibacter alginicilyticus]ALJ05354.1 hypothetical protein APS56_09545 [Pseudalgibacter alginicilyticus]